MKEIRLLFFHPKPEFYSAFLGLNSLENEYKFIFTQDNPDYLIASEHIYYNKKMLNNFLSFIDDSKILIFAPGECIAPDMNIFDYAITFDDNLIYDDRTIRCLYPFSFEDVQDCSFDKKFDDMIISKPSTELESKKHFCNFIYSHSNAHPMRDTIFHQLNKYQSVDSLGSHLNNKKNVITRNEPDWMKLSVEMKRNYKFSIAAENACYKGYFTEKIITSFLARTIPIYWGCPNIAQYFNPEAFINCHNYNTIDEVIDVVKQINENDELWCKIISEPRRTKNQIMEHKLQLGKYRNFLYNIFSQDKISAKRVGIGKHPRKYYKILSEALNLYLTIRIIDLRRISSFLKKLLKYIKV